MKSNRKRRGRGEGAVWQLADGTWCGQISMGGTGKHRKRRNFRGTTKQELVDAMAGGRTRQVSGTLPEPSAMTAGEFLTHWLTTTVARSVEASTAESYAK